MITRELLHQWDTCYDAGRIAALFPPDGLTPLEVCDLEIPAEDRLWVLLREQVIPASTLRLLACKWARGALDAERAAGREPDPRSWAAVETAERFARGEATEEEEEELAAAWDAAWDAIGAARDPARAAAWAAASAARTTARAAAWDAAWDAISAACNANGVARVAWDAQLADVRTWIAAQKGE